MRYFTLILILVSATVISKPDIKDYVLDPEVSDMELSPSGELIAFTKRVGDKKAIVIMTLTGKLIYSVDIGEDTLRGYEFADDDHLILFKSYIVNPAGATPEHEYYGAISLNFRTEKSTQLLIHNQYVVYPQNIYRILGPSSKKNHVLMTAWSEKKATSAFIEDVYRVNPDQREYTYDIFRVNLDTGKAKRVHVGKLETRDWFIDENEVVYAREDFDDEKDLHEVFARRNRKWKPIYSDNVDIREDHFVGLSADKQSLIVIGEHPSGDYDAMYHVSLETGETSEPIFFKKGLEIDSTVRGWNQQVIGVRYSGYTPSYDFYDKQLNDDINSLVSTLKMTSINIIEFSRDYSRVLFLVEGGEASGSYLIYDRKLKKIIPAATRRPTIKREHISVTRTADIKSRDGLVIPTLYTLPSNVSEHKNLPAIMMPHGGLENYDQIGFDYRVQYLASQGYVVIQPNYRGSSGFGEIFERRGDGQLGKEIQDDITDALTYFIELGLVNKDKVCILGQNYGGYSALAGGAFTPELYRCVVAIAPVSDLPKMLTDALWGVDRDHWAVAYLDRAIGDRKNDKESLKRVSPVYHADKFTAPVLILHGDDDVTIPYSQSTSMRNKLEKAGKSVTFIKLKDQNHWMWNEQPRLQAMTAIASFVEKHLK